MKKTKPEGDLYCVAVALPREAQAMLHHERARRTLKGNKMSVAAIASELLTAKVKELPVVE
jgi:hypothetical protein